MSETLGSLIDKLAIANTSFVVEADIGYAREKANCKCDECWDRIKKAIDSKKIYKIYYSLKENQYRSNFGAIFGIGGEPAVLINPDQMRKLKLWEVDPLGGSISATPPFGVTIYHEVIGHYVLGKIHPGASGYEDHPDADKNSLKPDGLDPKYVDPTIEIENEGRKCWNLANPKNTIRMREGRYLYLKKYDPFKLKRLKF